MRPQAEVPGRGIREVLVVHHSHTDYGYTHTQPVVEALHDRFLDDALELCEATTGWDEDSRPRWTCEVTWPLLRWLERASEADRARLCDLVRADRIGAGALPCNLTPLWDSDQLARALRPVADLRADLGLPLRVAINHDVNGLPQPVVGLLRGIGVELLLMGINTHFGGFPLQRPLLFRWRALDGAELLVFNAEHYQSFDRWLMPQAGSTERMAAGLAAYLATLPADYALDFVVLSATHFDFPDNNPPCRLTAEAVRRWNAEGRAPRLRFVTPEGLLERVRAVDPATIPTHVGDWPDYWNFGCASSAVETRATRRTKARLRALERLAAAVEVRPARFAELSAAAWHGISRFEEHTWGSWASVWNAEQDDVVAQWTFKAHEAWRARSLTGWLWRELLEAVLGNPPAARGAAGVLLHDPAPEDRARCAVVPTQLVDGTWEHYSSRVHNLECPRPNLKDGEETTIGRFAVGAGGSEILPLAELTRERPPAAGCRVEKGHLESPAYRLDFDPETGRVRSLIDRALGVDLFGGATEDTRPAPFGWVRETVDRARHAGSPRHGDRDALFQTDFDLLSIEKSSGWMTDWPARRDPAAAADRVETAHGPRGVTLRLAWDAAPGAEHLRLALTLPADRHAVEIELSFHKTDERRAESIYLALPFGLRNWRCHYDTSGLPVELDAEQLPGTVRDYQTVSSYVAVHDERLCCVLACPDAPMVQVGDFHFGRAQERVSREEPCTLLAWPMNNYWDTNFRRSQPGFSSFRWELTSSARFDPLAAARFGLAAASAVELHPVVAPPTEHRVPFLPRGVVIEGAGVLLRSVWPGHDGRSVQAELVNPTGEPRTAVLLPPPGRRWRAFCSSALEDAVAELPRHGEGFTVDCPPRSLILVRLVPGSPSSPPHE